MKAFEDLVTGGFLAQTIIVILVWGTIALLAATGREIPDPFLDAGFVIIGFYFRSVISRTGGNGS